MQTHTSVDFLNSQGLSHDFVQRFNSKFEKTDGCWNWLACINENGYGVISKTCSHKALRKKIYAHRAAWIINFGEIPKSKCVCHTCDNPLCVNPNHLWIGSQTDNQFDKFIKGRTTRGEAVRTHKITVDQVIDIRRRHPNESQTQLATIFGIGQSAISRIVHHKSWRHIQSEKAV